MIIAEFCQNHMGDKVLLWEMVHAAKEAGVRFCKIQSFFADDLTLDWRKDYERVKSLELDWDTQAEFCDRVTKLDMLPMTSVYTTRYLPRLGECGFSYIKVGSPYATQDEMIKTYIAFGFKVIISTGGHAIKSIPRFSGLAGVLHCVSLYPSDPLKFNLARMLDIKHLWRNTAYGVSAHINPHDPNWMEPLKLASYLGASYTEVHFTLKPRTETKDGPVSLDVLQMEELCKFDALPAEEKLKQNPGFGMIHCEQDRDEVVLINRYKNRFA